VKTGVHYNQWGEGNLGKGDSLENQEERSLDLNLAPWEGEGKGDESWPIPFTVIRKKVRDLPTQG